MPEVSMETVLTGLADRMEPADLAAVCDTLVWNLPDNGAELMQVCRDWLGGDDPARIEAALAVNGGFLFGGREDLEVALRSMSARFPQFRERAAEILRNWDGRHQRDAVRDVVLGRWSLAQAAAIYTVTEDRLRAWIDADREAMEPLLSEVLTCVTAAFGDLARPDFAAVSRTLREEPYRSVLASLPRHFDIIEPNGDEEDHSFTYIVEQAGARWAVYLSAVGPYAVLGRLRRDESWHAVLTPDAEGLTAGERTIIDRVRAAGLSFLDRRILEYPVPLRLDIAEPGNLRVFQALFTDTDILPWDVPTLRRLGLSQ
ncbi:hypothetical protein ACFVH6_22955 [Spirillospora sp. NPDC127200]